VLACLASMDVLRNDPLMSESCMSITVGLRSSSFVNWTSQIKMSRDKTFFVAACASGSTYCAWFTKVFDFYNENHGQRKRYKWHIENVSITPKRLQYVICIVFFGRDFHYKAVQHFRFSCTILDFMLVSPKIPKFSIWSMYFKCFYSTLWQSYWCHPHTLPLSEKGCFVFALLVWIITEQCRPFFRLIENKCK